jgi:hypothetical protein
MPDNAGCADAAVCTIGGELSTSAAVGAWMNGRSSRGEGGAGVSALVSLAVREDQGAAGMEEIVRS